MLLIQPDTSGEVRARKPSRRRALRTLGGAAAGLAVGGFSAIGLTGCSAAPVRRLSGQTMGTYFNVALGDDLTDADLRHVGDSVRELLSRLNADISLYDPTSQLSRAMARAPGATAPLDAHATALVKRSVELMKETGGAFDPTVGALAHAWGFGPIANAEAALPSDRAIADAKALAGFRAFDFDAERGELMRLHAGAMLDVNGIGKGYGVDRVAELLVREGLTRFVLEIGGEVTVRGHRPDGAPWRVGIAHPDAGSTIASFALTSGSAATSGDYIQFFERNGQRYSHVLDPRTGKPVTHPLASVTVVAEDTARADALSTALMVMGPEDGFAFASQQHIAACFGTREGGDELRVTTTPAFPTV